VEDSSGTDWEGGCVEITENLDGSPVKSGDLDTFHYYIFAILHISMTLEIGSGPF